MPSTTDEQEEKGLFALIKGPSGGGKSTGVFSFPDLYVFDADKKMPNIAMKHFKGKKIDWDTFESIFQITAKLKEFEDNCPYQTLFLDSFTYLCDLVIRSIDNVKGTDASQLLSKVTKQRGGGEAVEAMGMDYWGAESRYTEFCIDKLKKLWTRPGNPKHVIVSAHVVTVTSKPDPFKENKIVETRSIVSRGNKVGAWLPTGFDNEWVIGQSSPDMVTGKVRRLCVTEATGEDSAKCALDLPSVIDFTGNSIDGPNLYHEIQKYTGWK